MIETAQQLYQAIEQMGAKSPRNFAILAEGPLEQLRQLQKQVDDCIQTLEDTDLPADN